MIGLGFTLSSSGKFLARVDEAAAQWLSFKKKIPATPCKRDAPSNVEIVAVAQRTLILRRIMEWLNTV